MDRKLIIKIFSIDLVFIEIIKRIMDRCNKRHRVEVYTLFSEAKTITTNDYINLMIIDDQIIGASSYELMSFLRLKQKIVCPFIYFGVAEHDGERNAILSGANYFFNKPFDPKEVSRDTDKIMLASLTNLTNNI
ncbi:MAG: hypothetical protein PF444_08970 [Bacteroidales bacterium]|jgi:DNA-binding response OmpR family regulator|nr:hypothetical protein [Bacteroidales bacterium]